MKKLIIRAIALFSIGVVLLISCNGNTTLNNSSNSSNSGNSSSIKTEQPKEVESINGVYSGSQSVSGIEFVAKLTVSVNRWSATSKLGDDSPEYQNGVVNGKDLYDDSGMIKIGYVSGNSASINGYPVMRK